MFLPTGSYTPQLSEATLLGMFLLDHVSIVAACFPTRSQSVGPKISKGCHTQDNQSHGKALPGYQLFTGPLARPNMDTNTHAREVKETNVFTQTLWEPSCQSHQGLWKASHHQGKRNQHFKQNLIKYKLLQGHLPQGSEKVNMADMSTRTGSKVAGFWKVKVGWIL